jgi:hypothetical protein
MPDDLFGGLTSAIKIDDTVPAQSPYALCRARLLRF